ncbi:DUF1120 domain-containing protein [Lysobacter sp. A6]|uniref:DUF1120 domain-containing protein n=1 Tax=Noviluteimonas lactosilytica TaxID=2888523 RepID=A0ABS8JGV0_9GAMM|nr:DUF1120 domain-containing protein [Lysobacter lactosilyticus]MCC8362792.1 DUF1120 domain-containing protein [Lysobacter lactosilyticus]
MKLQLSLLAAALLTIGAGTVHANSVDLTVTGTITPPSCTIQLSNGGAIDLGQVDLATLSDVADNPLTVQNVDVLITCASAAKVATSVVEDRPGTASTVGDDNFGLNNTAGGNPIGFYKVFAENGVADTVATPVIASSNLSTWTSPAGGTPVAHIGNKFTAVGTTAGGPASATTVGWSLRIEPTIAPSTSLALTGAQAIDGQMTLTLNYL